MKKQTRSFHGRNEMMLRIIRLIETRGSMKLSDMAEALYVSDSTIKRYMKRLQEMHIVVRTGSDRKGIWKLDPERTADFVNSHERP